MNNRLPSQNHLASQQSFGLVGWLEQTRVQLPLKGVDCRFQVCGDLVNIEIDQVFHQNNSRAIDCVYTFPLPAGAAIYRCEMHVNGRIIEARVEERERAREMARQHKAAGRRTALVEVERENLFTLSLGNVAPGDLLVIRLAYFETLTRLADWASLRIPFCPGVRYIPGRPLLRSPSGPGVSDDTDQVPDASRISPPRMDALHPEAASLSITGRLDSPLGAISEISSASHPVRIVDGDSHWAVSLATTGEVPDRDFHLRWTESRPTELRGVGWVWRDGAEAHALVQLHAPSPSPGLEQAPQDFYFLIDRSGSMEGQKWDGAIRAFRAFLQHLTPADRAWVTFFNDNWQDFAERPMSAAELAAEPLLQLEKLGANGGTELLPSLIHILDVIQQHSAAREAQLILITDGQVGNDDAILAGLRRHPTLRVHCFGIDTAVNDALLIRVARQHQGSVCLLQPTDDLAGAVTRLRGQLTRPLLTSVMSADGWEAPAVGSANLNYDATLSLPLRHSSTSISTVTVVGQGVTGLQQTVQVPLREQATPAIRLLWARQRIQHLLQHGQRAEAIVLAKRFNLLCDGTAFIAWDTAEQVPIAERELVQPSLLEFPLQLLRSASIGAGKSFRRAEYSFGHPGSTASSSLAEGIVDGFMARGRNAVSGWPELLQLRLVRWFERFITACPFPTRDNATLAQALLAWVMNDEKKTEERLAAVEQLANELQSKAAAPDSCRELIFVWLSREMVDASEHREAIRAILEAQHAKPGKTP